MCLVRGQHQIYLLIKSDLKLNNYVTSITLEIKNRHRFARYFFGDGNSFISFITETKIGSNPLPKVNLQYDV